MFCRNCGSKIAEGSKFCSSCGARVEAAEAAAVKRAVEDPFESRQGVKRQASEHTYGGQDLWGEPAYGNCAHKERSEVKFDWSSVIDKGGRKPIRNVKSPWDPDAQQEYDFDRTAEIVNSHSRETAEPEVDSERHYGTQDRGRTMTFIDVLKREKEEKERMAEADAESRIRAQEREIDDFSIFDNDLNFGDDREPLLSRDEMEVTGVHDDIKRDLAEDIEKYRSGEDDATAALDEQLAYIRARREAKRSVEVEPPHDFDQRAELQEKQIMEKRAAYEDRLENREEAVPHRSEGPTLAERLAQILEDKEDEAEDRRSPFEEAEESLAKASAEEEVPGEDLMRDIDLFDDDAASDYGYDNGYGDDNEGFSYDYENYVSYDAAGRDDVVRNDIDIDDIDDEDDIEDEDEGSIAAPAAHAVAPAAAAVAEEAAVEPEDTDSEIEKLKKRLAELIAEKEEEPVSISRETPEDISEFVPENAAAEEAAAEKTADITEGEGFSFKDAPEVDASDFDKELASLGLIGEDVAPQDTAEDIAAEVSQEEVPEIPQVSEPVDAQDAVAVAVAGAVATAGAKVFAPAEDAFTADGDDDAAAAIDESDMLFTSEAITPEDAEIEEDDDNQMSIEELEEELFGKKIEDGDEEATRKIEKFYTLYTKNEEFQKLLDEEHEKLRAGGADYDHMDEILGENEGEETAASEGAHDEASVPEQTIPVTPVAQHQEAAPAVAVAPAVSEAPVSSAAAAPVQSAAPAPSAATAPAAEEKKAPPVLIPEDVEEARPQKKEKGGKALTIIAIIIAILLVILLVMMVILNFAPNSSIAFHINEMIGNVTGRADFIGSNGGLRM